MPGIKRSNHLLFTSTMEGCTINYLITTRVNIMDSYTGIDLGKSLKIALIARGLRQDDIAEMLGVSKQQVSKWATTGAIPIKNVSSISRALGFKVSQFIELGE